MKNLMIDYKNDEGIFFRRMIDNGEFCIREEIAYFFSDGREYHIPIKNICQVYSY